jgi:SNF2 family DNA or RNA helicase
MPSAEIRGNRIYVFGTPFAMKDLLKTISGAAWDRDLRAWNYPVSTQIVGGLSSLFPDLSASDEINALIEKKRREDEAQLLKTADGNELGNFYSSTTPWAHQKVAYHYAYQLVHDGGGMMLALDMGVGKSKIAIDLINNIFMNEPIDATGLIISPLSVVPVWPEQFALHSYRYHGVIPLGRGYSVEKKAQIIENELEEQGCPLVFVINYESVWREPLAKLIMSNTWDFIIADEIHKIKAPGGKASMFMGRLAERAHIRLGLTGTPMPHSPLDLYAQYRFLDKGIFGTSFTRFKRQYAVMGGFENRQVVAFRNLEDLTDKFDCTSFRVESEDVLDLPKAHHVNIPVELDQKERKAYNAMAEELVAMIEDQIVTASNALVRLLRLQQIVQGYTKNVTGDLVQVGTSKLDTLTDLLDGIRKEEKVVVFGLFKTDLQNVAQAARATGREVYELSGDCDQVSEWKDASNGAVLAVQYQSGGVGIDLTAAAYCVYMEGTFNYGNYEQSLKRIHRPGQRRPVTYYHLIADGTIDVKVYKALQNKEQVIDSVLSELTRGV